MALAYAQLASNPETREATLRLQKKVNPDARFPELEIADRTAAATGELKTKLDAQAQELAEIRARETIREERAKLRGEGFSDADISGIEAEIIEAKKTGTVLTYESAARYWRASHSLATPTPTPALSDMNNEMPSGALEAFKKGGTMGLKKLTRERAGKALDDILAGRIRVH